MADLPNILVMMTDQERAAPPYESDAVARFRREHLPARASIADGGLEFHRHYVGSTACLPSRATLFTGQYPSLHGVAATDGLAKKSTDPAMRWLDPDTVPTLGDWFRAAGYRTHYRGKWHISHADLLVPGSHEGLMTSDAAGNPILENVAAYRKADRLDPFGFSGWVGREPHGAARADCGSVRDEVFCRQVVDLFDDLAATPADGPWLAVTSFVNPHDIAFHGLGWERVLRMPPPDDSVPEIPEAPSQSDSFAGRPPCQEAWITLWPQLLYPQEADLAYRRLYYHLLALVDAAIGRVLDALAASGMADDTVVVLTSDHGEMLGAHGGMVQKWYNAFDETVRVPLTIKGPGVAPTPDGVGVPTSHVDLLPTLLGLAGVDLERAAHGVAQHHAEAQVLPGRDLSDVVRGTSTAEAAPVYFMTEDDISRGLSQQNLFTGATFEAAPMPSCIESVVAPLPTGVDGGPELWKLVHYYERLDEWHAERGIAPNRLAPPPEEPRFELHNLSVDPEERSNLADVEVDAFARLQAILGDERDAKRRLPAHRNPVP